MSDPLIDSVVGQYQVLSRLGGGAMGVVYKARDTKLGRLVALKFLPPEWSHDEDAKQRFVREAQAASSTDHANICTVHDIQSTEDGRLFIVMAHYEGQTLKQRLAGGALPIAEALNIATQVADGLARAHGASVVHRDVKPGNIILTEDAVKIVDFGLATLAGSVQLTQAGSPMGTVAYMAPEQLRGLGAMPQSDVWAVGVMLYEMLAGHPPFQGAYAEAISYAIRHDTPPPLRAERPEIPEDVEQLVFRALHKDPGVRFASGRELARALRLVQGHTVPLELQTAVVDVSKAQAGHARTAGARRWRALAIAALVFALLGGSIAWYVSRPPIRTFVAVAPVENATGDRTLDPYRLALTLELTRELAESRNVRVLPYARLLAALRRFLVAGTDPSSPEAVQAVAGASDAA
ncbi:MAG TPA: serine/threonine-protein kinase, partial [Vicinamibacterales bacterium]|nr:serine/threonine-protein kinase [Vicinamibacterales bacterium]